MGRGDAVFLARIEVGSEGEGAAVPPRRNGSGGNGSSRRPVKSE